MGYFATGQCRGSAVEAAQAACSQYPVTGMNAGQVVSVACIGTSVAGDSLSIQTSSPGASAVASTLAVSFAACDETSQPVDLAALWILLACSIALVLFTKQVYQRLVGANH